MSNTIKRSVREGYCLPKEENNEIWIGRLRSWILSKKGIAGKSLEEKWDFTNICGKIWREIMLVSL